MKNLNTLLLAAVLGTTMLAGCDKAKEIVTPADAGANQKGANSAQTAQSIMIVTDMAPTIISGGSEVWKFDRTAAAMADFGYNSCNPATTGPGNGNSCRAQADGNAFQARCSYWTQPGHPFWNLETSSSTGSANVDVNVTIAGLSVVLNKTHIAPGKASFSLTDSEGLSRFTNLRYSLDGGVTEIPFTATINTGDNGHVAYTGNAGSNGVTSLLANFTGTMGNILLTDSHAGNNTFTGNTDIATAILSLTDLPAGTHALTIKGTVKGNEGLANYNFTHIQSFTIDAQGCQ